MRLYPEKNTPLNYIYIKNQKHLNDAIPINQINKKNVLIYVYIYIYC